MSDPKIDVAALAKLARLEVSTGERARLEKEIPDILKLVDQIQAVDVSGVETAHDLRNVMREDDNPHKSGTYTETLLSAAPSRDGDHITVKQVISRKK